MGIMKRKFQEGVVILYVADGANLMDIDVADDIKEVEIWRDFTMPDTNKSFPNVETLTIKPGVSDIRIPNSLFPNVRYVNSESTAFLSGKYLVETSCEVNTLLNAFCQESGETIDLTGINRSADFAFSGCKAEEMEVCDAITSFHQVHADAFTDSAFSAKPFVNGLKLAGNLVLEIDKTTEDIELPDTPYNFVFLETADISHIKSLTVHHPDALHFMNDAPETIVLKTDKRLAFSDITTLAHHSTSKGYVQNFSIIHPGFKEIDGVVYTKSKKTLVACSISKKYVEVLDGTEEISASAFARCNIEEVVLPDSLKTIGKVAFTDCERLKIVKFGNGLKGIDMFAFFRCRNLKHIDFTSSLKHIHNSAFAASGFKEVDLNEDLESIKSEAFDDLLSSFPIPPFGYDTLEEASAVVRCGEKYLYIPRNISRKAFLYDKIKETIIHYFLDTDAPDYISMLEYSTGDTCRDAVAVAEFCDFGNENAKSHIKQRIRRILPKLLNEKNEKCITKLIMADIIPDDVLEWLWKTANRENMSVVQAYLLEYMKKIQKKITKISVVKS